MAALMRHRKEHKAVSRISNVFVRAVVFRSDERLFDDQATETMSNEYEYDGRRIRSLRLWLSRYAWKGTANPPGEDLVLSLAREAIKQIVRMVLNSVAANIPSDLRVVRKYPNSG